MRDKVYMEGEWDMEFVFSCRVLSRMGYSYEGFK